MLDNYVENADYSDLNDDATVESTGEKAKDIFCKHWEQAKTGLELAQMLCKKSLLKWILGLAIIIGNKIEERICN